MNYDIAENGRGSPLFHYTAFALALRCKCPPIIVRFFEQNENLMNNHDLAECLTSALMLSISMDGSSPDRVVRVCLQNFLRVVILNF